MITPSDPPPQRRSGLSFEYAAGLVLAIAAHAALIAALTLSPLGRDVQPPPQRMVVSFAPDLADKSASPKPDAQPAPDLAPTLGEAKPAEPPQPRPSAAPEKPSVPIPAPKPAPVPKPQPKPAPKPEPKPEPRATNKPEPKPAHPKAEAKPAEPAKPDPRKARTDTKKPAGGSRIDSNFLKGIADSPSPGKDKVSPGDAPAAVPVAALINAISRQIKPHWSAPQGVDAEKLVTVLAWSLNPDGTLAGRPTVVSQTGITDANRAQAQRHAELAIRAVQLAAPFNLPPAAYAQWRHVVAFRFDRKLSQ